jgi:hypothetical protein
VRVSGRHRSRRGGRLGPLAGRRRPLRGRGGGRHGGVRRQGPRLQVPGRQDPARRRRGGLLLLLLVGGEAEPQLQLVVLHLLPDGVLLHLFGQGSSSWRRRSLRSGPRSSSHRVEQSDLWLGWCVRFPRESGEGGKESSAVMNERCSIGGSFCIPDVWDPQCRDCR